MPAADQNQAQPTPHRRLARLVRRWIGCAIVLSGTVVMAADIMSFTVPTLGATTRAAP